MKPHIVVFPFPAQGHIRAMLKLADLLHSVGFQITFINTVTNHHHLLDSSASSPNRPNFRFLTIPDPHSPASVESAPIVYFLDLEESLRAPECKEKFREVLVGENVEGWAPVTCVLGDASAGVAFEVAEEVGVPVMAVATNSACSILAHIATPEMVRRGEVPFPEEANMDEPIQGVPGMETFLRRRDLPTSFREAKSLDDRHLRWRMRINDNISRATGLILNTAECLDSLILPHIRYVCPVTYAPGPPDLLLKRLDSASKSKPANLFEVDTSCIAWLNAQSDKSVVYVSFGSITVISKETFLEFWNGLINTGRPFLWVIRRNMVEGGIEVVNPEMSKNRYLVEWAPQEEVLAHPAVGCFFTHCGWNSTLESIVAGVPMVCWPFFTDQLINSRFVSEVWKIGVDMKDLCDRRVVESMVRKVMDGEYKRVAMELAKNVRESSEEGGSSHVSFMNLVEHIKTLSCGDERSK